MKKSLVVLFAAVIVACTQKSPEAVDQEKTADSYYLNEKVIITGKGVKQDNYTLFITVRRAADSSQTTELNSSNWSGLGDLDYEGCGCDPAKLDFYNTKQKGDTIFFKKLKKSRFK